MKRPGSRCSEPRNPRVEFFPKSQLSVCTLVWGKDIWVLKQHGERGVICTLYMISIVSFLVIYTCMYRYVDIFYSYIHLPPCPLSLYVWRDLTNHSYFHRFGELWMRWKFHIMTPNNCIISHGIMWCLLLKFLEMVGFCTSPQALCQWWSRAVWCSGRLVGISYLIVIKTIQRIKHI